MGPVSTHTRNHIIQEFPYLMAECPVAEQSVVDENLAKEILLGVRQCS